MKTYQRLIILSLFAFILSACANIPQAPTKTPTMSADQQMTAAVSTVEALHWQTETQRAIDNPSPTPTDTATPTPEATPTSALPLIPPTATEKPLPYYNIDNKSSLVYKVGDRSTAANPDFVPHDTLYVEICYQNNGSATWTANFHCACTNGGGGVFSPADVMLNREVKTGEWACFSFQQFNGSQALGPHTAVFQLYNDMGSAVRNGNNYAYWNIH